MNESSPKIKSREVTLQVDLSEIYGFDYLEKMIDGHFKVVPAVIALDTILRQSNRPKDANVLVLNTPTSLLPNKAGTSFTLSQSDDEITFGNNQISFEASFTRARISPVISASELTDDERNIAQSKQPLVSDPGKLTLHTGIWKLADSRTQLVNFHAEKTEGVHRSNFGYFTINLTDNLSEHLHGGNIPKSILIELATQQIAATLIEEGFSTIINEITLLDESLSSTALALFPIQTDFRLKVLEETDKGKKVSIGLVFKDTNENIIFGAEVKASTIQVRILEMIIKMQTR